MRRPQSFVVIRAVTLLTIVALAFAPRVSHALPPWARRYNMSCSGCHSPAVPRLNATGIQFKWAGYRMPDEIGEKADMRRIREYLGQRTRVEYAYARTTGDDATNDVTIPLASAFLAGPFGRNFGAYVEIGRESGGAAEYAVEGTGTWGKETSYGGLRVGMGHLIYGGALAGLDRPTGIAVPLAIGEGLTAAVPFRFSADNAAAEAFWVFNGRNRLSVRALRGLGAVEPLEAEGEASVTAAKALRLRGASFARVNGVQTAARTVADPGAGGEDEEAETRFTSRVDLAVTNQFMWDANGSGVALMAYFGSTPGLDFAAPDRAARYTRFVATANKIYRNVELLGGYALGRDTRLPLLDDEGTALDGPRASGAGYWGSAQYSFTEWPVAVYGRYETLDRNRDRSDDQLRRWVVGAVKPLGSPEYVRLGLEWVLDDPQRMLGPRRQRLAAELLIAF
ncbi:MAG: hypothetical protein K2Y26_04980 [Gemmatimonadaceae bacterium]|uniref:hypothetical protein n=1 Tax=Gemmatimonas sp. UBA7669 TaxID=1946568 RepID=UPI0025C2B5C8|nr:hypothetical protein [Gemmatimonas sp. UBA7669]MBX9854853.1 hypothetical protein [Gemmatimonadaceae bacterium]